MIFLSMAHFMAEDNGDFIVTVNEVEQAGIDAHIMSQRTKGVEGGFIVDEIVIGLFID